MGPKNSRNDWKRSWIKLPSYDKLKVTYLFRAEEEAMATEGIKVTEGIKWAREIGELQLLHTIINSSVAEAEKIEHKATAEKTKVFKTNMFSLIDSISGNGISAFHLSRFLIILINQILLAKEESALTTIKISGIDKNIEQITNSTIALHRLCKEENFRMAMCKIQANFATECVVNTESPVRILREQLRMWQLQLSKEKTRTQPSAAKEHVQEIEERINAVIKETNEAREFCEKYKVDFKTK